MSSSITMCMSMRKATLIAAAAAVGLVTSAFTADALKLKLKLKVSDADLAKKLHLTGPLGFSAQQVHAAFATLGDNKPIGEYYEFLVLNPNASAPVVEVRDRAAAAAVEAPVPAMVEAAEAPVPAATPRVTSRHQVRQGPGSSAPTAPAPPPAAVVPLPLTAREARAQLLVMGFPEDRVVDAIRKFGADVARAAVYLMDNARAVEDAGRAAVVEAQPQVPQASRAAAPSRHQVRQGLAAGAASSEAATAPPVVPAAAPRRLNPRMADFADLLNPVVSDPAAYQRQLEQSQALHLQHALRAVQDGDLATLKTLIDEDGVRFELDALIAAANARIGQTRGYLLENILNYLRECKFNQDQIAAESAAREADISRRVAEARRRGLNQRMAAWAP